MLHRVQCSSCGMKSKVQIASDGTILSEWAYFGTVNINRKSEKYYYKDLEGKEKVENPEYDGSPPQEVEMWECPTCYRSDEV